MADTERLDKLLSNNGFGTRKDVKKLLHAGIVTVNDEVIRDSAFHVNPQTDKVCVEDEVVTAQKFVYIMMNKCQDVVSANKDGEHETVFDLLDSKYRTGKSLSDLHTIGRLDIDTEGLLLLTTDGSLTHTLISPKSHIDKTYLVFLRDAMDENQKADCIKRFTNGIHIPAEDNDLEADCAPAKVEFISKEKAVELAGSGSILPEVYEDFALLTIFEGKYHQVKRMFLAVDNKVVYLKRISIGNLKLDSSLKPGEYRELSAEELELLR